MAGVSTPELAASVTRAGGLGSIAVGAMTPSQAIEAIGQVRKLTSGPLNVNVFCHKPAQTSDERERAWLQALAPVFKRYGTEPPQALKEIYTSFNADNEMQTALLDLKPSVVSFHFGLPPQGVIDRFKAAGVVLLTSATSVGEARLAAEVGVDAIVAQGFEAGGHRGVFDPAAPDAQMGVFGLTRLLVEKIALPIVAAGGIMDGAGIAAVLKLGAVAAQMGTAFVACQESGADAAYRTALLGPGAWSTEMTSVVSGRPARSLPNAMTELDAGVLSGLRPPDYPIAYDANKSLAAAARKKGEYGFAAQWAGQGAPLVRPMPAALLMSVLANELRSALDG